MCTGQILPPDACSATILTDTSFTSVPQQPECNKSSGKYGKIQDGLEAAISIDGKNRITRIISEIKQLSDVEKLLLYLKLPTGGLTDDHQRQTPPSCLQASNRTEQAQALTWIKSHLEEHSDVCMPKQEVYDDYKTFCENHGLRPLCNPDFGKMMKYAFPDIIARRLGKRGQSKYFYGGLKKKLDMAPPVLPELQIKVRHTEDESKENDDLLLAAGQVVCEWAQKLLEQSFSGLRDLAEHLVGNLYVGSKSVAAFTVIAAMQESGNQSGKNSALFSATGNSTTDKHRETQLQLQRKLQEKKILEEQRRKMNAVREENEQQIRTTSSLDRKTPLTPKTASRSSVSLERKTPKLSSTPSPLPLQSPRKIQTGRSLSQSGEHIQPLAITKKTSSQQEKMTSEQMNQYEDQATDPNNDFGIAARSKSEKGNSVMHQSVLTTDPDNVFIFPKSIQENDESKTPEHCQMETEDTPSHVRRIDFGEIREDYEETRSLISEFDNRKSKKDTMSREEAFGKASDQIDKKTDEEIVTKDKSKIEQGIFSQSAGQISLKMLLERKDSNENNLNKSLGFVSSRNTNLFSGQSSNLSRSAFVPFSPSRKEVNPQCSSIPSTSSSTLVSYKQEFCKNVNDSLPKSATITITPVVNLDEGATDVNHTLNRPPDNIIHIQPGNTYQEKDMNEIKIPKSSSIIVSFSTPTKTNGAELINTTVTSGNLVQCSSATQDLKTPSLHMSPGASKQIKTPRFTPIKPKSSPQKSSTYTKSSSEVPAYDKRPVSAILKEKREREKAEAFAKIQASIRLPAIPTLPGIQLQQVTPALSLATPGQVTNIAPLSGEMLKFQASGNIRGKDVVIFVNNSGTATVPTVITPASTQCIPSQIIPLSVTEARLSTNTEEIKSQSDCNDIKGSSDVDQTVEPNKDVSERDTPDIDDIIFSPGDSLQDSSAKNQFDDSEIGIIKDGMNEEVMEIEKIEHKSDELESHMDESAGERLDSIDSQTPIKIAKLNVDSPFRPESACSLGRETPIKIMKTGDMSVSRPESACSHGRETPSGGRKRKSSGNTQQRNFKRLNSTGEVEDTESNSVCDLGSNLLGPQKAEIRTYNQRRTHSCTLELDKDRKQGGYSRHNKSFTLDNVRVSVQSPDITSLEREALIDAFPHTTCTIKPSKAHAQKSSIGVSSEAFRNALKLKKQQEYLNERVNTFLMKENMVRSMTAVKEQTLEVNDDTVNLVADEVQSYADRNSCYGTNGSRTETVSNHRNMDLESDIPSDVADFINETLEKRQSANNSVLSEPSRVTDEKLSVNDSETVNLTQENGSLVTDSGKFVGVGDVNSNRKCEDLGQSRRANRFLEEGKTDDHFTVPKVPPFSFRLRESNIRLSSSDLHSNQQRCSSLPTFTSPTRSPISPLGNQGNFQRSTSISPVVAQSPDREISKISQGALRRVEIRENHPISVNVHPNINLIDDGTFVRPNSLPIRITHCEEKVTPIAPYLASLQHNLQKPREIQADQRIVGQKESPVEKQSVSSSPVHVGRGQLSRESSADRTNFTPFSDRGYHSIGNSPVLNSTPVSLPELEQLPRHTVSSGVILSPQSQTFHISSSLNVGPIISCTGGSVININQLNSSTTSAFIPIQGSYNDMRYVTPIRPMATVASEKKDGGGVNPNDKQEIQGRLLSASSRVQDPPPYEYAVKQLRKSNSSLGLSENSSVCENLNLEQVKPDSSERISLLATMGQSPDLVNVMGPCSSRLAQLSRQSKKNSSMKPSASHPNIMSALTEPTQQIGQLLLNDHNKINGGSHLQEINESESSYVPSTFNTNDLMAVSQQNSIDSGSLSVVGHLTKAHVPDGIPLYGESKTISSLTNVHSTTMTKLDADEINVRSKIFDPSFNILSENIFDSNGTSGKLMQPVPDKMLSSIHHMHSNLPANICSLGQTNLQEDAYQEMSRHEFTNVEADPLGSTLEDLKEILSDKSVVGDNGFYGESDMSASEEGIGELLFGDEQV